MMKRNKKISNFNGQKTNKTKKFVKVQNAIEKHKKSKGLE